MALFFQDSGLDGKTFSVLCNNKFWEFEQTSDVHLRGFEYCRKKCCPFRHEKQTLLSATIFALCVGVFPRNTGQLHRVCVSLQAVHLTDCVGRTLRPTVSASALDVEENNLMRFSFS